MDAAFARRYEGITNTEIFNLSSYDVLSAPFSGVRDGVAPEVDDFRSQANLMRK